MPCKDKKGKQRRLCFATDEFKDFSKIKRQRKIDDEMYPGEKQLNGNGIIGNTGGRIRSNVFN